MPRSRSRRSTVDSNASMVRGSSPRAQPALAQLGLDEGRDVPARVASKYVACLISSTTPISRPCASDARAHEVEHIAQPQDGLLVVERRTGRPQLGQPLAAAEGGELVPREVLGEPAGELGPVDRLRRAAVGELGSVGDIGRARDLVLVPHDQHAVLRDDDVRLDRIDSHLEREVVRGARVLGPVPGRAAVSDHEGAGAGHCFRLPAASGGDRPRRIPVALRALSQHRSARECPLSDIVDPQHSAVNPFTLECESSGPQQPRIQQPGLPGPEGRADLPGRPERGRPRRSDPVRDRAARGHGCRGPGAAGGHVRRSSRRRDRDRPDDGRGHRLEDRRSLRDPPGHRGRRLDLDDGPRDGAEPEPDTPCRGSSACSAASCCDGRHLQLAQEDPPCADLRATRRSRACSSAASRRSSSSSGPASSSRRPSRPSSSSV